MAVKTLIASVLLLGLISSDLAMAGSATAQSAITGTVVPAGSLSPQNVDVGLHTAQEFESMIFSLPVTIDLTMNASGTLYVGTPGSPLPLNNGNSVNVAGGGGVVWATVFQPGNVTVITSMSGMSVTGEGTGKVYNLGLKIQPQNNYIGSINGFVPLAFAY